MKVLIICGTAHKGSTYHIARIFAEKITDSGSIREMFLPTDFCEFCCGCTCCIVKGEERCPHYEKLRPVTEAIDEADVLIFASPVYVYHVTGQMKALLDHYGWRFMVHRPEEKMFSKQAVAITTAAGAGMKSAIKDITDSFFFWGIPRIYKYGKAVMESSWDRVKPKIKQSIEKKTDSLAVRIRSAEGKKLRIPLKTKGFFKLMSLMQRNGFNEKDKNYWIEKGWTGKARPWKKS